MNTRHLIIASLAGGVASALLSNVPVVNFINCLLCAGFWLGPLLAVWLYRRQAGTVTLGQGILIGTLAGLVHGLLGFVLSFFGVAGAQALEQTYAQFLPAEASPDSGLTGLGALAFNLAGVVVGTLFGALGGLIGGAIWQPRRTAPAAAA